MPTLRVFVDQPKPNDKIAIHCEDERGIHVTLVLSYEPHDKYERYVWRLAKPYDEKVAAWLDAFESNVTRALFVPYFKGEHIAQGGAARVTMIATNAAFRDNTHDLPLGVINRIRILHG